MNKKTIEQLQLDIKNRNNMSSTRKVFLVDGQQYLNNKQKLKWTCVNGHEWSASVCGVIHNNSGCQQCLDITKRKSVDTLKKDIVKRNKNNPNNKVYLLPDQIYISCKKKLKWTCKKHHIWENEPRYILRGDGCPVCAGNIRKNIDKLEKDVKKRNTDSPKNKVYLIKKQKYINGDHKLQWTCIKKHKWTASPRVVINNKTGCPICALHRNVSLMESKWLDIMEIPDDSKHRQVKIHINKKTIVADGYNPKTKTVYEFFGDYFHGHPSLIKKQKNPKTKFLLIKRYEKTLKKEKMILAAGYKLIKIWECEFLKLKKKYKL